MKKIILAYVLIALVLMALLSIFSYGYSAGYVYIQWRDTQIQTNIWVLLFSLVIFSFIARVISVLVQRYLSREKRKTETILSFQSLHPYEQLAVIWLLDAEDDQKDFIHQIFSNSGLLKGVVDSHLYTMQNDFSQALESLDHINIMAFELAEIQRIKIYLAQNDAEKALTHLEFISQHEVSSWLEGVKSAYQIKLIDLWGVFAVRHPWLYLKSTQYGHLREDKKQQWLELILSQFEHVTPEDLEALKQRYLDVQHDLNDKSYDIKVLWLKVLSRLPEMIDTYENLVIELLNEKFNQDVFYLWFQQQVLKHDPDYIHIEQRIRAWEDKYPSMPIFSFVKWYLYIATQREEEANLLLDLYPDNVLMSYLRVKSQLKNHDDLIHQLNVIFENNSNYLEIKI